MKKHLAYFAGYGHQYWLNVSEPTLKGLADGITVCEVNPETGEMKVINGTHGEQSPATLVLSPDGKYLYAANELSDFKGYGNGGGLTAYKIDGEGGIEKINDSFSAGACTAYITIDKTGKYLLVANHGSYYKVSKYDINDGVITPKPLKDDGCICLFEVREDGGIGKFLDMKIVRGTYIDNLDHSTGHPHSVLISDDDWIVVPDKGGDAIYVYKLDRENKKLVEMSMFETEYNSCPRHAMFVKDSPYVLVLNEMNGHIGSYHLNREDGKLTRISYIDTEDPNVHFIPELKHSDRASGCDVQIHPNQKFVYLNNSQMLVELYYLDLNDGSLKHVKNFNIGLKRARGIQISPDGKLLTVTGNVTNKAVVFKINEENGYLERVYEFDLPTPTALRYQYPE